MSKPQKGNRAQRSNPVKNARRTVHQSIGHRQARKNRKAWNRDKESAALLTALFGGAK